MFEFIQRPGSAAVLFDEEPILTFTQEQVILRQFLMGQARLRPGGPEEIVGFMPSAFYGLNLLRADITVTDISAPDYIELVLTPTKVDRGLLDYVRERRTLRIDYDWETRTFRYTFTADIDILQDIDGDEGLYLNGMCMPAWGDDDYAVVEFDDPLLSGGVGPQVPMTQDWEGLPEPVLAEDCYTLDWKKRYLSVTLDTTERGLRRIAFNRVVNGAQQFYNRYALKTVPRQPFYYQRTDGRFLKMTPHFDYPAGHHICEWGYDVHFYAMLPKAAPGLLFAKGQHITLSYSFEDVAMDEVPLDYLTARPAEIEPEELPLCDLATYEEPVCTFTRSTLDCPDSYGWRLNGAGGWNRTGGKEPGTGALEIHHDAPAESVWLFNHFGPSYATNPIPPLSTHRIAAWIKADEIDKVGLVFTLDAHQGPAMYSPRIPVVSTGTAADIVRRDGDWALLEFTSNVSGTYNLAGRIAFTYSGTGHAAMSGLRVERI